MSAAATPAGAAPVTHRSWVDPQLEESSPTGFAATTAVPEHHPCFAGHYPGAPVFPGMLLVEAVDRSVRRWAGGPGGGPVPAARELVSARFSAPVLPGDAVRCSAVAGPPRGGDGLLVRARLATAAGPVASVSLRYAPTGSPDTGGGEPPAAPGPGPGPRPEDLLPHRPPMLFLDRVGDHRPGAPLVAEHDVTGDEAWFDAEPRSAGWPFPLVVESLFQAGGALLAGEPDAAPAGTLLLVGSASGVAVLGPVPVGATLRHRVELVRRLPGAVVLRGRTWVGARAVLDAGQVVIALRTEAPARGGEQR